MTENTAPLAENATLSGADAEALTDQVEFLRESLAQVTAMFASEDRGWVSKWAAASDNGLSLGELQEWGPQVRNAAVGNPHVKRGLSLRTSHTWGGGMKYSGLLPASQGRKGASRVEALIKKPVNQRNFFGPAARARLEANLFSDGIGLYEGVDKTKTLRNIPFREITADYRDPDYDSDIWAYRRTWQHFPSDGSTPVDKSEWIFTDTFKDKATMATLQGKTGEPAKVNKDKTIFDMHANSMDGCAYGSPDALAAVIWSRIVRDLFMDGKTMTSALATFAFKATVATKTAGNNASIKLADKNPAGSTAVVGGANDLAPLSSAGKGYDFKSFEPVVAIVAAALDLTVEELTGTNKVAGDTSSSLPLGTRGAISRRRDEHIEFNLRILAWMGAPDAEAHFSSLIDPTDLYRAQQGIGIKWGTGLYTAKEIKTQFEALEGNDISNVTVPAGVLVPNTQKTLDANAKSKAAAAPAPAEGDGEGGTGGGANPTQGAPSKFGGGKGVNSNDINRDR